MARKGSLASSGTGREGIGDVAWRRGNLCGEGLARSLRRRVWVPLLSLRDRARRALRERRRPREDSEEDCEKLLERRPMPRAALCGEPHHRESRA